MTGVKLFVVKLVYLVLANDGLQERGEDWSCFLSGLSAAPEAKQASTPPSTNLDWNVVEQVGGQRELLGKHDNLGLVLTTIVALVSGELKYKFGFNCLTVDLIGDGLIVSTYKVRNYVTKNV